MSISVPEDTAQGIVDVVTTARKNDGKKKKAKAIMTVEKELPRPTIAHMLYEFLPLIDEHTDW